MPTRLPAVLALALAVWLIYASDRLLDVLRASVQPETARHRFHSSYTKRWFTSVTIVTAALTAVCCFLRPPVLTGGLLLGFGIALYMAAVHILPRAVHCALPKELHVGVLFAAGTCLAPLCNGGWTGQFVPAAVLFAAICCLNCCAIEVWEWDTIRGAPPHAITRWCVRNLEPILWFVAAIATVLLLGPRSVHAPGHEQLYAALILSCLGFLAIANLRLRISTELVRMLVDLPLLSPILFLLISSK